MELQWQRQQEHEALLAAVPASLERGGVLEVQGLQHLEAILEAASGQLVVLTVYSRWGQAGAHARRLQFMVQCAGRTQAGPGQAWRRGRHAAWAWQPQVSSCHHWRATCWLLAGRQLAANDNRPLPACLPACRSCGICKDVLRELDSVCQESRQQRARIVFLQHDMQVCGWVGGWVGGWAGGD